MIHGGQQIEMDEEKYNKLTLTQEIITAFLEWQKAQNRIDATLQSYGHALRLLYEWLPEDKKITPERLKQWKEFMVTSGYASRTINSRISSINSFLAYAGYRDMQIFDFEKVEENNVELTREEYILLLQEAKALNDYRLYLIIKVLGTTGIPVQYLARLSVAEVTAGHVKLPTEDYRIPPVIQRELLAYATMEMRTEGVIFLSETGKALSRTYITWQIKNLGQRAGISEEKVTPRRLKQMCQKAREDLLIQMDELYGRMLQEEERIVQWFSEENIEEPGNPKDPGDPEKPEKQES